MYVENAITNSITAPVVDVLYNPHTSTRHSYSYCAVASDFDSDFDADGNPIAVDLYFA